MGVLLTPILKREQTSFRALYGRSFAVDASIELHQFLALIRKPDGALFTDSKGRVTSHLIGLLTRTSRLITDYRLRLVFVFDGSSNPLKRRTIEARKQLQQKAQEEYKKAIAVRDYSKAWSKVVMTGRLNGEIIADSKRLLTLMGIPWIEAVEDGEAQASYMASKGDVWAVGSKDYDCLLFGAPVLARYLTLTGREFLPSKKTSRRLVPELVSLEGNLKSLGISREQLVDLALLVGTDFNEGVAGVGPKKALTLIKRHGYAEELPIEVKKQLPDNLGEVRDLFLHPRVLETYSMKSAAPDPEGLHVFLCDQRGFSQERVSRVSEKLIEARSGADAQLGEWIP